MTTIKARKNGNCQRALDMRDAGKSVDEIAATLGILPGSVRSYLRNYAGGDTRTVKDDYPRCRCGLRLFGTEEVPGQCDNCLQTTAAEFAYHRGGGDAALMLVNRYREA